MRGGEWLYNYLRAFYLDDDRPFGVNNKVFDNVGMPHVLLELQGRVRESCGPAPISANGEARRDPLVPGKSVTREQCGQLSLEEGSGSMTPAQYDAAIYDLVNYLQYVGEPSALQRQRYGCVCVAVPVHPVGVYLVVKQRILERRATLILFRRILFRRILFRRIPVTNFGHEFFLGRTIINF